MSQEIKYNDKYLLSSTDTEKIKIVIIIIIIINFLKKVIKCHKLLTRN